MTTLITNRRATGWLTRALALVLLLAFSFTSVAPVGAAADPTVVETVGFTVQNINRTLLPCNVDGGTYQVQGVLVGPASLLHRRGARQAITLYLHGLVLDHRLWTFDAVPTYDFALDLAALGQVSLVIDRLGYGASGHPYGFSSCLGGQADVAHQLVQDLRSGSYTVLGGTPMPFSRVTLMGLSFGGAITELEAYSFRDVDAIGVLSFADGNFTQPAQAALGQSIQACNGGGQPSGGPGSPSGYALFGPTAADLDALVFYSAVPPVVSAATSIRAPDPCGDLESFGGTIAADLAATGVSSIGVPVLLVYGLNDAFFLSQAGTDQRAHFTGSKDVTLVALPDTGHALPLELTAGLFRVIVAGWLTLHGF